MRESHHTTVSPCSKQTSEQVSADSQKEGLESQQWVTDTESWMLSKVFAPAARRRSSSSGEKKSTSQWHRLICPSSERQLCKFMMLTTRLLIHFLRSSGGLLKRDGNAILVPTVNVPRCLHS